jgi:hypothetical protein
MSAGANKEVTQEAIINAIHQGATSLSQVHRALGYTASISSSQSKKYRALVPDIELRFAQAQGEQSELKKQGMVKGKGGAIKAANTTKKSGRPRRSYPRTKANPFREGSSYALAFDVLSSFPKGVSRQELLKAYSKASGKDLKHAGYDLSVLLSAQESVTGPRHRSCREGFWVERQNDHVTLRTK